LRLGKLSLEDLRGFLVLADQVDAMAADLRAHIDETEERVASVRPHMFGWGQYYDMPPVQHLALVLRQFGLDGFVIRAALDENPTSALLALAEMEIPDEMVASEEQRTHAQKIVSLAVSLQRSFRAIGYYGKWMHELIASGSDDDLLRAITVDPVASGNQAMQDRLARAVFFGEGAFLERFRVALKGPSKKISRQHNRIRVAGKLLVDAGAFPMPEKNLVRLFCDELKLYTAGEEPGRALKKVLKVITPTPVT
jgi:hypothetical protein